MPPRAFNETLRTPKHQSGYGTCEVALSRVGVKETCRISRPKSKPYFSPQIREKPKFLGAIMGHKNLGKVPVPRVVSMTEEPINVSRRPRAWTVRPRQRHIARRGLAIEKKLQRWG